MNRERPRGPGGGLSVCPSGKDECRLSGRGDPRWHRPPPQRLGSTRAPGPAPLAKERGRTDWAGDVPWPRVPSGPGLCGLWGQQWPRMARGWPPPAPSYGDRGTERGVAGTSPGGPEGETDGQKEKNRRNAGMRQRWMDGWME